ncbi:BnaC01g19220D [Brassica napus]|uniref:BnaC01g19220D protein n=1 Tax=Brassica napus TaxID=3708 RepID=A0A078GS13_BRANA|nr:BnaC01g19220D [Brassica napus]
MRSLFHNFIMSFLKVFRDTVSGWIYIYICLKKNILNNLLKSLSEPVVIIAKIKKKTVRDAATTRNRRATKGRGCAGSVPVIRRECGKVQTDMMKEQLATFKSQLEEFARKHKNDIRKNPAFRAQFHEMCAKVGVDPLASNKGFWAELLGIGDFYYELGVQIIEVCMLTRSLNGGLISLQELCNHLRQRRKKDSEAVNEDDCLRAISKLKVVEAGKPDRCIRHNKSEVKEIDEYIKTNTRTIRNRIRK